MFFYENAWIFLLVVVCVYVECFFVDGIAEDKFFTFYCLSAIYTFYYNQHACMSLLNHYPVGEEFVVPFLYLLCLCKTWMMWNNIRWLRMLTKNDMIMKMKWENMNLNLLSATNFIIYIMRLLLRRFIYWYKMIWQVFFYLAEDKIFVLTYSDGMIARVMPIWCFSISIFCILLYFAHFKRINFLGSISSKLKRKMIYCRVLVSQTNSSIH